MGETKNNLLEAILLIGPTGSGKTPLGEWLAEHGLGGRRCKHFDFGANLRAVAARGVTTGYTAREIEFLQGVLERGALLEAESFYIAEKIFDEYVGKEGVTADDWLILNGLPRHVGQSEALANRLQVRMVVRLICTPAVVRERLRLDSGGDRKSRVDDSEELVSRKLAIFEERTRPLLEYYQARGAHLVSLPVGASTLPEELAAKLQRLLNRRSS